MRVPGTAKYRIQAALEVLSEYNYMTQSKCISIKSEYLELIEKPEVVTELKKCSKIKDRLDIFLMNLCEKCNSSSDLKRFMKIILVLFHGNAEVERSFSINKHFLVDNLEEKSLIAQRSVHDYITSIGKVSDIKITKEMISAFKKSSANRVAALNEKKELEGEEKKSKKNYLNRLD